MTTTLGSLFWMIFFTLYEVFSFLSCNIAYYVLKFQFFFNLIKEPFFETFSCNSYMRYLIIQCSMNFNFSSVPKFFDCIHLMLNFILTESSLAILVTTNVEIFLESLNLASVNMVMIFFQLWTMDTPPQKKPPKKQ